MESSNFIRDKIEAFFAIRLERKDFVLKANSIRISAFSGSHDSGSDKQHAKPGHDQ